MANRPESAGDRLWREKLDLCSSQKEAVVLVCMLLAVAGVFFICGV